MTRNASIRATRPGAGKGWWKDYLSSHLEDIDRRFGEAGAVYWEPASGMPLELFAYIREASLCFSIGRFLATLSLSGAVAEIILNRDPRLAQRSDLKRREGWILLNNKNLATAKAVGLPIDELLESGETVEQREPVRFVRHRNKVAHGEPVGYAPDLPEQSADWEHEARDQLAKASRFLVSWFNSAPEV